jgi:hypothetical protein
MMDCDGSSNCEAPTHIWGCYASKRIDDPGINGEFTSPRVLRREIDRLKRELDAERQANIDLTLQIIELEDAALARRHRGVPRLVEYTARLFGADAVRKR